MLSNGNLWKRCRHLDIRQPVQSFLYRAMNDATWVDDFWSDIPGYEQRVKCASLIPTGLDGSH